MAQVTWNKDLLKLYPKLAKFSAFKKFYEAEKNTDQRTAEQVFKSLGGKLPKSNG